MKKIYINNQGDVRLIWRFLSFIIVIFAMNIPFQVGLRALLEQGLLRGVLSGTLFIISVLFSAYIQIKYIDKSSYAKYGLKLNRSWFNEFFIGCTIAAIQLGIYFLLMYSLGYIQITDSFVVNDLNYSFVGGFLSTFYEALVAGITEEVMIRSFLFVILFESFRKYLRNIKQSLFFACLLASAVFGMGHYFNESATVISNINLTLDGMMLAMPFIITGRLGMSIGMHFSWNLIQGGILGLYTSGELAKVSILKTEVVNNLLTGGTFGPEGSALLVLLDLVAVFIILGVTRRDRSENLLSAELVSR